MTIGDRPQAKTGVDYNPTTPSMTSDGQKAAQCDKRGVSYIGAAIRHSRIIDTDNPALTALPEGACDSIRIHAAGNVFVFGQPPEKAWQVVNGGFDTDTNWTKGANWAISGGVATHTAGSTATLSQDSLTENPDDPIIDWGTYIVIFEITGRTAGSVTPSLCGTAGSARSADGTWGELLQGASGGVHTVVFTPTSDFDGSIDNVYVVGPTGPYAPGVCEPASFSHLGAVALASDITTLVDHDTAVLEAGWYRRPGATELG